MIVGSYGVWCGEVGVFDWSGEVFFGGLVVWGLGDLCFGSFILDFLMILRC